MVEQTESNTREAVKETAADSGYGSYANYAYLEQTCPQKGERNGICSRQWIFQLECKSGGISKEEHRYHYSNFTYDALSNSYVRPEGSG